MTSSPIPPTPRQRGGQPNNQNALKHGFYSRTFDPAEQAALAEAVHSSLSEEIDLLRIVIRRTLANTLEVTGFHDSLKNLEIMSQAIIRVARLLTLQPGILKNQPPPHPQPPAVPPPDLSAYLAAFRPPPPAAPPLAPNPTPTPKPTPAPPAAPLPDLDAYLAALRPPLPAAPPPPPAPSKPPPTPKKRRRR